MLLFVSACKGVLEVALMALAGQGVLAVLVGRQRAQNPFFRVLQVVTRPVLHGVRRVLPAAVPDRHVPWLAAALLALVWALVTAAKIAVCLHVGVALCR